MARRLNSPTELSKLREKVWSEKARGKTTLNICAGTGCQAYGSEKVFQAFREEIKKQALDGKIEIKLTGCHGYCERGVIVVLFPEEICYLRVKPEDVP